MFNFLTSLYNLREAFTMEETFIFTGIFVLAVGIGLGFLVGWIFDMDNKDSEESHEKHEKENEAKGDKDR